MLAKDFYRLAGQRMKDLVKLYGFKKNGRFFYRITEEGVIQQFCLLCLNRSFTVRFYISDIYSYNGRDIEGAEIFELINGSINQWLSDSRSDIDFTADDLIFTATNICIEAVQKTLLPFFELNKDPLSVRNFITSHNPRIIQGIDKYDIRELGLFLSLGDLSSAKDYLTYHIENCNRYNKKWRNEVEQEYRSLLEAITSNDMEYISAYMEDKKNKTYAEYKWK